MYYCGDDLKQIRGVVQDETRKIVQQELRAELDPLKKDVKELKSDAKTVKKDTSKIRKDVNTIVNYFDGEYLELKNELKILNSV